MKLISINIEANFHTEVVLDFLKKEQPDVVCIQELLEEEVALFEKELGLKVAHQSFSYWRSEKYPTVRGKKQGIAIFAKNIIDAGSVFYFGKEENILKSFDEYISDESFLKNRAFVWVETKDKDGKIYKFITTQISVTKEGEPTPEQLAEIDCLLKELDKCGEFVLCGDMNSPRGKESFSCFAKKYKDNIPLEYKTSIDQNLHRVKGIQFVVDVLFTTPNYLASNVKLIDGVSDHMAVVAEINKN